ncbi:MAG: hypothetical protein WEE20_07505 [Bacteroidota bacterium]
MADVSTKLIALFVENVRQDLLSSDGEMSMGGSPKSDAQESTSKDSSINIVDLIGKRRIAHVLLALAVSTAAIAAAVYLLATR